MTVTPPAGARYPTAPAGRGKVARRCGAATVELALFATLLMTMMLGMIELGRALMARQALTDAARKGARTGIQTGETTAAIQADVSDILEDFQTGLSVYATITVLVNGQNVDASTAKKNDQISVQVSVPVHRVLWIRPFFLHHGEVESETIVMMQQG
jgi:Flp pilus assembly protein TadG